MLRCLDLSIFFEIITTGRKCLPPCSILAWFESSDNLHSVQFRCLANRWRVRQVNCPSVEQVAISVIFVLKHARNGLCRPTSRSYFTPTRTVKTLAKKFDVNVNHSRKKFRCRSCFLYPMYEMTWIQTWRVRITNEVRSSSEWFNSCTHNTAEFVILAYPGDRHK